MVYTDALDAGVDAESLPEDDPAQPEFVHKIEQDMCMNCEDKVWTLGEVSVMYVSHRNINLIIFGIALVEI